VVSRRQPQTAPGRSDQAYGHLDLVDMSGGPHLGHEMASRATAYRCWRAHGDVGLLETRTPPGWKPVCAPLVSGLPRESYSSLARFVGKILEVVATVCSTRSGHRQHAK
jgi:hypothetical protein